MPDEIASDQFQQEVLDSELPVLVDFYATWCPPCQQLAPVIERIGQEYEGRLKIIKVNTDNSPDLASRYQIRGVPTLMMFKGGATERTMVGFRDYEALKEEIDLVL